MLPDNRIRFNTPVIDFDTDVGVTGQSHDTYPSNGSQLRYDWMRMFLIGLLSSQSSYTEPTQYRHGTIWFDLTTSTFKAYNGTSWVDLSELIGVGTDNAGDPITLSDMYTTFSSMVGNTPTVSFGGYSTTTGATIIPVPSALQPAISSNSRPFVWVDGLLVDPRLCAFSGTTIVLSGGAVVDSDQSFTVMIISINQDYFSISDVVI